MRARHPRSSEFPNCSLFGITKTSGPRALVQPPFQRYAQTGFMTQGSLSNLSTADKPYVPCVVACEIACSCHGCGRGIASCENALLLTLAASGCAAMWKLHRSRTFCNSIVPSVVARQISCGHRVIMCRMRNPGPVNISQPAKCPTSVTIDIIAQSAAPVARGADVMRLLSPAGVYTGLDGIFSTALNRPVPLKLHPIF
jgi:hypothetical protein